MDDVLDAFRPQYLEIIAEFLAKTVSAGRSASEELSGRP